MRTKVIQWATGNTGRRALEAIIKSPDLDLVGVRVYDDIKDRARRRRAGRHTPLG